MSENVQLQVSSSSSFAQPHPVASFYPTSIPLLSPLEPRPVTYTKSSYVTTKRQNKVCKESVLCGSDNIGVQGKTIIESNVTIRGDLATIEIGTHCILSQGVVIRPCEQRMKNSLAASIGSYVYVGANTILGKRTVLASCVYIVEDSVLPNGTVCAPFTVYAGNPAVMVGALPPTWPTICKDLARSFFKNFVPQPSTANPAPNVPSAAGA
jgi:dynactin-5